MIPEWMEEMFQLAKPVLERMAAREEDHRYRERLELITGTLEPFLDRIKDDRLRMRVGEMLDSKLGVYDMKPVGGFARKYREEFLETLRHGVPPPLWTMHTRGFPARTKSGKPTALAKRYDAWRKAEMARLRRAKKGTADSAD